MSSINTAIKATPIFTAEGARAVRITPLQELVRLTMCCMLWEDNFYVDGKSIASRIAELVHEVTLGEAAGVAIEARNNMKLRHVPLLICRYMANHPKRYRSPLGKGAYDPSWVSSTITEVIQRPDELSEFLAIYWKDGKQPLSKQVKLGLAKAFTKFNEYQLAKYNRKKDIMLRDVLFLCHSKPTDVPADAGKWDKAERRALRDEGHFIDIAGLARPNGFSQGELLYGKLIYDQLQTPDTWEVELSQSKDKLASWHRLLSENKLGDLAFLRNLRNMREAGIADATIAAHGSVRRWGRVLPFRFISAARMVPQLEPALESWMFGCVQDAPKLRGTTRLLVDVSGSMSSPISAKSDLSRLDAAKALAILLREVCENVEVWRFNYDAVVVPARRGFALGDAIGRAGGGTSLGQSYQSMCRTHSGSVRDIIITDEQSSDPLRAPNVRYGYLINVAANRNGIGYGPWLHVDGFSEAIIDYIQAYEAAQ